MLLVVIGAVGVGPAAASEATQATQDELAVTIDSISPAYLKQGEPLAMTGRITNLTDHAWTNLRVYLVMPPQPLTSRDALDTALAEPDTAGRRLVELEALEKAGDLGPGDTTTFHLNVPYDLLGVSGTGGVYPVSAQVLATNEKGIRANQAVGRAHTLVPALPGKPAHKTDTAIVWPFTTHVQRRTDGTYSGTKALLQEVSPGGRLRRLLDLARSGEKVPMTVLVDPSLLDALSDIVTETYGPPQLGDSGQSPSTGGTSPTPTDGGPEATPDVAPEAQPAEDFLKDFVAFASKHTVWSLAYGQPDVRALTRKASRTRGADIGRAASAATSSTLKEFGLTARQVFWPTGGVTAAATLSRSREFGNRAAIVSPTVVSGWDASAGSVQRAEFEDGSMPVVVDDPALMDGGTQGDSALETRQRLVSETALAALEGGTTGHPTVAVVIDPRWDPGTEWANSDFFAAFGAPWVRGVDTDDLVSSDLPTASVELPPDVRPTPITRKQVRAAAAIVRTARVLAAIVGDESGRMTYYNETAGLSASQDWRTARQTGIEHARAHRSEIRDQLGKVSVEATEFVTLSGKSGRFPITITNHLDAPVTVGVQTRSDNPSLQIENIEPTEIGPGQSLTVTVDADVGGVSNSAATARLVTPDGKPFGSPTRFSVRSSVVGTIIWIGMGFAGLLVVAAVARRLWRRTRGYVSPGGAR